jgi:hypothetical protein
MISKTENGFSMDQKVKSLLGLERSNYFMWNEYLTPEKKEKIMLRLDFLWENDKEKLLNLIEKNSKKEIHKLFDLSFFNNGYQVEKWVEKEKKLEKDIKYTNNLMEFEYQIYQIEKKKKTNVNWKKFVSFSGYRFGRIREKQLNKESKKRHRRCYSQGEEKHDEWIFFAQKIKATM